MVTALYRRYRPETFAEMIGQSQVTDPLRTALRTNRVNHAYLFSGPRGCGKTTSARILARCLNCAEGPTDTPCGVCDSCVELSRDGGGSLDVVEIDAASHNGVDDARDLRERAIFAPARDRYKIFILDEAHMVTPQGFNALLKIVEEPPEHVKFIFATTEPDKVIGTIRSRTHHYPFRLIPPAQMLDYVAELCEAEGMSVEPGVLPLVVRAGGGSARDTLSLLDQLMAGSEGSSVDYERAVSLLGYTHTALLDEVADALAASDAAGVFGAVDRVIQTGQDPRRFVDDLLERLRDLIVVAATSDGASAVMRGIPQDELDRMSRQASAFGQAELSRAADLVGRALTEMSGATSPRLHLELMMARILVPAADATARGALARVERLERRVGVDGGPVAGSTPITTAADGQSVPPASAAASSSVSAPAPAAASTGGAGASAASADAEAVPPSASDGPASAPAASRAESSAPAVPARADAVSPSAPDPESTPPRPTTPPTGTVSLQQLKDAWPEVLERVGAAKRGAWMVAVTATVRNLEGDVLTLTFPSQHDVESFKQLNAGTGVSEYVRQAILDVLGIRVKYIARVDGAPVVAPAAPAPAVLSATPVEERSPRRSAGTGGAVAGGPTSAASPGPAASADPTGGPAAARSTARAQQNPGRRTPPQAPADDDVPPLSDDDAPPDDSVPPPLEDHERPGRGAPAGRRPGSAAPQDAGAPRTSASSPAASSPTVSSHVASSARATAAPPAGAAPQKSTPPSSSGTTDAAGWHVVAIPGASRSGADAGPPAAPSVPDPQPSPPTVAPAVTAAPVAEIPEPRAVAAERPIRPAVASDSSGRQNARYGEAVVREILGARFIEEQPYSPPSRFTP
ncbi:DNA polymerase III subunit gamma and tau [Labedella populi]|uniref:DNA-directed DNA polymerase n=1 Tax=Labedella populi TaxID=2498850 RepID=A0A3S3ZZJ1_9MICO|nr:DNA polymerase III subunit gamma and tau [Labedella populi]RWZ68433.1 DNA polymerase III subunit gamma and tau [Labedella populi]